VKNFALNKEISGPNLPYYCSNCTKFGKEVDSEENH